MNKNLNSDLKRGERAEREEIISLAAEIALRFADARRLEKEAAGHKEEAVKMEEMLDKLIAQELGVKTLEEFRKQSDFKHDHDYRTGIVAEFIAEHPEKIMDAKAV